MSRPGRSPDTIGRFAPSPTGDLHFGSLVAAVASFLQAKCSGGKWLVRMEDIDPLREVAGSAARIIQDLADFGLCPDGPVLFQSSRFNAYDKACAQLLGNGQAYWCGCSRRDIPASGVYPGTCRGGIPRGRKPRAIRIRVDSSAIQWQDLVQGGQAEELESSIGDFVIKRADGFFAYQLAVVIDDALQGVTEVVRGADLLDSTPRQIWLQKCLGFLVPQYAHVPVVISQDGRKLSKRLQSDPVRRQSRTDALRDALSFLGHSAPDGNLPHVWEWAHEHWSAERVPKVRQLPLTPVPIPGSTSKRADHAGRL